MMLKIKGLIIKPWPFVIHTVGFILNLSQRAMNLLFFLDLIPKTVTKRPKYPDHFYISLSEDQGALAILICRRKSESN